MRFYIDQICKDGFRAGRWQAWQLAAAHTNPKALAFIQQLMADAPHASRNIAVLPAQKVLYVTIHKSASSRIKYTLSEIAGRPKNKFKPGHMPSYGNPPTMKSVSPSSFYHLATHDQCLRFSFVRNPYDRIVSAWASKFQNKPLVPGKLFKRGTPEIDTYLKVRKEIDLSLPAGIDSTLSFPNFVVYATAMSDRMADFHLTQQHILLNIPGINVDFIGNVENFQKDINVVLDYARATVDVRSNVLQKINSSTRANVGDYFSHDLVKRVYQAYEGDFDAFKYPRELVGHGT